MPSGYEPEREATTKEPQAARMLGVLFCGNDAFNFRSHRPLVGTQPLEVRPRHEDDGSRAERQEQHDAEVEFYSLPSLLSSVHLNETSGATARARGSRSSLRIMALSTE